MQRQPERSAGKSRQSVKSRKAVASRLAASASTPVTTPQHMDSCAPAEVEYRGNRLTSTKTTGKALLRRTMPVATLLLAMLSPFSSADALGDKRVDKIHMPQPAHRTKPPRSRYNLTIPLDPPGNRLALPKVYGTPGRPLVVIDAGHGGHDPGAVSAATGSREKDITLAVAQAIKAELIKSGRVRVALTREDDRFLVLGERSALARAIKADLFISIHADSAPADEANGATIYTLSEVASDREATLLALRENKADIVNGVNLGGGNLEIASILLDLAQRETMTASVAFANLLKREATGLVPFRTDYHRMAGFVVLKAPDTASILLEVGYLTNIDDVERLSSDTGKKNLARGIRKAIEIHFARRFASR